MVESFLVKIRGVDADLASKRLLDNYTTPEMIASVDAEVANMKAALKGKPLNAENVYSYYTKRYDALVKEAGIGGVSMDKTLPLLNAISRFRTAEYIREAQADPGNDGTYHITREIIGMGAASGQYMPEGDKDSLLGEAYNHAVEVSREALPLREQLLLKYVTDPGQRGRVRDMLKQAQAYGKGDPLDARIFLTNEEIRNSRKWFSATDVDAQLALKIWDEEQIAKSNDPSLDPTKTRNSGAVPATPAAPAAGNGVTLSGSSETKGHTAYGVAYGEWVNVGPGKTSDNARRSRIDGLVKSAINPDEILDEQKFLKAFTDLDAKAQDKSNPDWQDYAAARNLILRTHDIAEQMKKAPDQPVKSYATLAEYHKYFDTYVPTNREYAAKHLGNPGGTVTPGNVRGIDNTTLVFGKYPGIDKNIQLALEKLGMNKEANATFGGSGKGTGGNNHGKYSANNAISASDLDGAYGPETAAAIKEYLSKHPELQLPNGEIMTDALAAAILKEAGMTEEAKAYEAGAAAPAAGFEKELADLQNMLGRAPGTDQAGAGYLRDNKLENTGDVDELADLKKEADELALALPAELKDSARQSVQTIIDRVTGAGLTVDNPVLKNLNTAFLKATGQTPTP